MYIMKICNSNRKPTVKNTLTYSSKTIPSRTKTIREILKRTSNGEVVQVDQTRVGTYNSTADYMRKHRVDIIEDMEKLHEQTEQIQTKNRKAEKEAIKEQLKKEALAEIQKETSSPDGVA